MTTITTTTTHHIPGHDCPLCKKPASLFFNNAGGYGPKHGKGAWAYFGCKRDACGLVVYNSNHGFQRYHASPEEIRRVINPMVRRWNKLVAMARMHEQVMAIGNGRRLFIQLPQPPVPKIGTVVRHSIFGIGLVKTWDDKKRVIGIQFEAHGLKELTWAFAGEKIKRVRVVRRTSPASRARRTDKSVRKKR